MKRIIYTLVILLLVLIVAITLRTLLKAGTFKNLQYHSDFAESMVRGVMGAEDIQIDWASQKAYISSCDRRKAQAGEPYTGAIYFLDLSSEKPDPVKMPSTWSPADFRPHGISLFRDADSSLWLFAVNHPDPGPSVEVFEIRNDSLFHTETITGDFLKSPNDLVATGRRQFYFTNDHGADASVSHWKDFVLIGTGEVGYFDGEKGHILEAGLRYPNGINTSADGKELFVALTTDGSISVYQTEPWSFKYKIHLGTGVDNLDFDEAGNLWTAAHPKMLAFLAHAKDPAKRSPSQVLMLTRDDNGQFTQVEELYLSDGNPLSGSSVAVNYNGKIFVGSVFEDGVLVLERR
ncbi:MAG: arylesterase [Saprospiraceae bacterium]